MNSCLSKGFPTSISLSLSLSLCDYLASYIYHHAGPKFSLAFPIMIDSISVELYTRLNQFLPWLALDNGMLSQQTKGKQSSILYKNVFLVIITSKTPTVIEKISFIITASTIVVWYQYRGLILLLVEALVFFDNCALFFAVIFSSCVCIFVFFYLCPSLRKFFCKDFYNQFMFFFIFRLPAGSSTFGRNV